MNKEEEDFDIIAVSAFPEAYLADILDDREYGDTL